MSQSHPSRKPVLSPIVLAQLRSRYFSRRRALSLLGGVAGAAVLVGCGSGGGADDDDSLDTTTGGTGGSGTGSGSCVVTPSATEGPFFVDEKLNRADIRPNTSGVAESFISNGVPLHVTLSVFNANSACAPLSNVQVDIWHCHAGGLYSDVSSGQSTNTTGKDFLRGYQVTDSNGQVAFTTIYPGWYAGRTVHIHIKARIYSAGGNVTYTFNTQGFFDDSTTDVVMAASPYNTRGARTTRNDSDNIYGGRTGLLFDLSQNNDGSYNAALSIGLSV